MITPRVTRLVRSADLGAFRAALVSLACEGDPLAARDRLVIVPTHAAAAHLLRSVENRRLGETGALILPEFATPGELPARFGSRLAVVAAPDSPARREVILGLACRDAIAGGAEPPFRLRPGLIAQILQLYDALRRRRKDVATFERLALGLLQPGADYDRGAERLVRQTRFLAAAFRAFERRCLDAGCLDEHGLRDRALTEIPVAPWRHVVVAVGDQSADPHGLWAADWDLLARAPGVERLDVVVTDTALAGAFHERVHDLLPGIEEVRPDHAPSPRPRLRAPVSGGAGDRRLLAWSARDREEEVAAFARWVRDVARDGETAALDNMALIVRQPLPYVYLTREVLRSGGVPCQTFDALPLAGEPYAATFDVLCSFVSANFARVPAIALLRSAHLRFVVEGEPLRSRAVVALDRALSEAAYLGEVDMLERLTAEWRGADSSHATKSRPALPAAIALLEAVRELEPLRAEAPVGEHLDRLLLFLTTREHLPGPDDPLRARQLRARGAILGILSSLRDAYRELDPAPVTFDRVAALVRRWVEGHTFSPRAGDSGVHVVDADSARFGDFTHVQLAGLVDGEWPERPRRNVFYSPNILRELGWPAESARLDAARAAFVDLLGLPSAVLTVSTFALEDDAVVAGSTLLDEVERSGMQIAEDARPPWRMFEFEMLGIDPVFADPLDGAVRTVADRRLRSHNEDPARYRGRTEPPVPRAYALSALERYQDCPFKFFAADVLRLDEPPDDDVSTSPRVRGRFLHELLQRFFEEWDRQAAPSLAGGSLVSDRMDAGRALFEAVAATMLTQFPPAEAALEYTRLFGSAISPGIIDMILDLEAARPADVQARSLEFRLEGEFRLAGDGRRVSLKGVADRIDLLSGNRLRVIDYKSGSAPNTRRALQVPIYALCAQERLSERDGLPWTIDEAAYVAFSGKRAFAPVVRSGARDREEVLAAARGRLLSVLDGVEGGEFPPRPHDPIICGYCAYAAVCRKDYVGDE